MGFYTLFVQLLVVYLMFDGLVSAAYLPLISTPDKPCCFVLNSVGPLVRTVKEDAGGDVRLGGVLPDGAFCITDGILTDSFGHVCNIGTTDFQFTCTTTFPAEKKFTIADNSELLYDGRSNFFACTNPSADGSGSYNLFSDKLLNSSDCDPIQLLAGGFDCAALGSPTSVPSTIVSSATSSIAACPMVSTPASSTVMTARATSTSGHSAICSTEIVPGAAVGPSLIIPVSQTEPDTAYGPQVSGIITSTNDTAFNFDLPGSFASAGGHCALVFEFPYGNEAAFPYKFSGFEVEVGSNGGIDFAKLDGNVNNNTSYDDLPAVLETYGKTQVEPGFNYTIAEFPCQANERVTYMLSGVGGFSLQYHQSSDKSPLGLFIVHCF